MAIIKLLHAHTHADVALPAGTLIDVDEPDAQWLLSHGIATALVPDHHAEVADAATDADHTDHDD